MKLHEVPNGSRIRLLECANVPPDSMPLLEGDEMDFRGIDGFYSTCFMKGERVYPGALTEVEIIE